MTQTLSVRIDSEVKKEFDKWCNVVGMNASTAVNMFVKEVLRSRKLPFEVTEDPFYSDTNMEFLKEGIAQLNAGKGIQRELIEVDE